MSQSKSDSFIEQIVNTVIGFCISMAVWAWIVAPLWDYDPSFMDNLGITAIFTVTSILRGYVLRRVFNTIHLNYGSFTNMMRALFNLPRK